MKFFKNKQETTHHSGNDKVANWVATRIAKVQGYWAKGMDKYFNRLSARTKKIALIGSCVVMVLYSTTVIAFSLSKSIGILSKPASIIQPLSIVKPPNPMPVGVPVYIRRVKAYKNYLDSLSHTPDGRKIRDSILQRRPGLLDSIQRIEIIYCKR
jgi:hypothetical protein